MYDFVIFMRGFIVGIVWASIGMLIDPKMRRVIFGYMGIRTRQRPRKRWHA